ncbi:hypothetical protein [Rheinheimera texasensis]|uniref:hypothetical protein n=1 Tax=Rheinheimera texasensis TaxID=306205 RepID=UPI0004E26CAE|nr:hypothetical protein [Rheinheimera texasensis]
MKNDDLTRSRWMVFIRCVLAAAGGFLVANLSVAMVGLLFTDTQALATYSAMLFSFTVWLLVVLLVFHLRSVRVAALSVCSASTAMLLIVQGLQIWRGV